MKVPADRIVWPDERARARYSEEQRAYLRASLGKYGQLSDILVRPLGDGRYEGIDGESRFNELVGAGASDVDVKVLELNDRDSAMVNILMNVARGDQDPMGVSLALGKALEAGMALEDVAIATGHELEWVRFMLLLKDLPSGYQEALRDGRLLVTHIRQALRLPGLQEIDAALSAAIRFEWNTTVMKNYVDNRIAELTAVARMRERTGVEVPPPAPEPERLATYAQCLVCGEMVPNEQLNLPRVCDGCYTFSKYAVSQCGKGDPGMQRLYKALELHQAWDQERRQFLLSEDLRRRPLREYSPETIVPSPASQEGETISKPRDMSPETWARIKALIGERGPPD